MIYAGFWRRFCASFLDALVMAIPTIVASSLFGTFGSFGFIFGVGTGLILGFLYKPFFESSVLSATPGKALMGIVVLTEAGDRISFKTAMIRFFSTYISALALYIGYLIQPFTSRRQTLHDMISETVVIRKQSEDLNYFTVWKNQFKEVTDKL